MEESFVLCSGRPRENNTTPYDRNRSPPASKAATEAGGCPAPPPWTARYFSFAILLFPISSTKMKKCFPFDALPRRGGTVVETAVPGGFRHVFVLDPLAARQIRDGAGHLEKPVVSPVAETKPGVNVRQQPFRSRRKYRVTLQHPALQLAVPSNARPLVPFPLDVVSFGNPLPGFRGRHPAAPVIFRSGRIAFLLRQLHLKVDAIQKRPGNP